MEYDDVMNKHRETIYRKRREILAAENLSDEARQLINKELIKILEFHTAGGSRDNWNLEEIYENLNAIFPMPPEARTKIGEAASRQDLEDYVLSLAEAAYKEKEKQTGEAAMRSLEKMVMLRTIDMLWMDHLQEMDYMRDSVRLRAYGQKDPLVEYKNEGRKMFLRLLEAIQTNFVQVIYKVQLAPAGAARETTSPGAAPRHGAKVGRNDPCPCGSGKKYKKCHGK